MNRADMENLGKIEYRDRVERAAFVKDGEPVYNATESHAQIVVETLFRNAKNSVTILNTGLNDSVYGNDDTLEAVARFLRREGANARVLVEAEPKGGWRKNFFLKRFGTQRNLEVQIVPKSVSGLFPFNFFVADGDSYRFEPDKSECAAVAAFGNSDVAEHLQGIFEQLWEVGQPNPEQEEMVA